MKAIKREFKAMLKEITSNSITSDLKDNFVRQQLINDTTKPMMSYTSSMLKLRAKIDRDDEEAVELFNSAHQGSMDSYGMLLSLISTYDEHYIESLILAENRKVQLIAGGLVTQEEIEDLQEDYLKLKNLHKRYVDKANDRINSLKAEIAVLENLL